MLNLAKGTVTNRRCALHIGRYTGFITLVLAANQILPTSAYADDPVREAEHDVILHMNEQIQELQAKVKELEARLNTITPTAPAHAVGDAPVSAPSLGRHGPRLLPRARNRQKRTRAPASNCASSGISDTGPPTVKAERIPSLSAQWTYS